MRVVRSFLVRSFSELIGGGGRRTVAERLDRLENILSVCETEQKTPVVEKE